MYREKIANHWMCVYSGEIFMLRISVAKHVFSKIMYMIMEDPQLLIY